MNLAISSIAWMPEEQQEVALLLKTTNVKFVELAPTKIWDDPTSASDEDAARVVKWWTERGISVNAFQSMLFSRPDLKLFESEANREQCLRYLKDFIILAGRMGVQRMVFGSPKNRQLEGISYEKAFEIAIDFFRELAWIAYENQVIFCIEPNAPQYGCDFVTNAAEGADLVGAVNHPGFGLHLDTACMSLGGDDLYDSIKRYAGITRHFHISSPMLEQVERRDDVDHAAAAAALKETSYNDTISIEMRPSEAGENVEHIAKALRFAQETYLA